MLEILLSMHDLATIICYIEVGVPIGNVHRDFLEVVAKSISTRYTNSSGRETIMKKNEFYGV